MTNTESNNDQILDADGKPISGFSEDISELNVAADEAVAGSIEPDQAGTPETEVEQLQRQLAEAEDRVIRSQAELDNFRKRTRREMDERAKFASLGLMNDILLSIDNLQLATQASQSGETEGLLEGVKMVGEQLVATLAKHGCEKIESVGQPFDPNQHEAVQMQPNDETPANHVSLEVRTGYKLHDRIIRPSQVFVSTGPAQ